MNKLLQSLSALGVSATLVTPNLNADATTNTTPQIKGANDIVIKKGQDYNLLNGISAFDKEDGDLTDKIKVDGQIDTSKSGKYQIKYHVTDSDGAIKFPLGILRLNSPHHYTANKMVANEHVLLPFYLLFQLHLQL
ncbi:Chitinase B [Staphylococcus aureus]|uniref:Chitinase B n=7 Tax=Bacteria TaxID=2 RepID=A0A380DQT3_STAAU|nr:Chitinase B [Staphylococcus aureus]